MLRLFRHRPKHLFPCAVLSLLFADHSIRFFVVFPPQLLTDGAKRVIKRPPAGCLSIKKQLPAVFSSTYQPPVSRWGRKKSKFQRHKRRMAAGARVSHSHRMNERVSLSHRLLHVYISCVRNVCLCLL